MAEERIYVRKCGVDNPCDTCEDTSGENCDFCMENYEWNASITRTEAIEKMAKGMYLLTNPEDTKYADFYNCYFFELAEAALNALLGEK